MVSYVILAVAGIAFGWVIASIFQPRKSSLRDRILIAQANSKIGAAYEEGYLAGTQYVMDILDSVLEGNEQEKGEAIMTVSEDIKPVAYTYSREEDAFEVYDCAACVDENKPREIAVSKISIADGLLNHARFHGTSVFTVNDSRLAKESKPYSYTFVPLRVQQDARVYACNECAVNYQPISIFGNFEVFVWAGTSLYAGLTEHAAQHGLESFTLPPELEKTLLTFKQVTIVRDDHGLHHFECGWCLEVRNSNGLLDHAFSTHRTEDYLVDRNPVPDSWRGDTKTKKESPVQNLGSEYSLTGQRKRWEGFVEYLKPEDSVSDYFKDKKNFPATLRTGAGNPWTFKDQTKMTEYLKSEAPEGFDGTISEVTTQDRTVYRLYGPNGEEVPWRSGELEMSINDEVMKDL